MSFVHKSLSRRRFLRTSLVAAATGAGALLLPRPGSRQEAAAEQPPIVETLAQDVRHARPEFAVGDREGLGLADEGPGFLRLEEGASIGSYLSPVVESGFPFTHAGIHWLAATPAGSKVYFEARTSVDGFSWSPWLRLYIEAAAGQAARGETFATLINADRARYLQYRATLEQSESGSPAFYYVTVTFLNTLDGPRRERSAAGASLRSIFSAAQAQTAKPVDFTREQWNADETLRFKDGKEVWPRMYVPTKKIVVHHTAGGNDYDMNGAAAEVRAIYYYHAITLGWGDIGYNCLIDRFGRSFEGRFGRQGSSLDSATWKREILSAHVVAGHALSHNYGSMGVALLGNHEEVPPSMQALARLRTVLTYACGSDGIDPLDSSNFLRSDGKWNNNLSNVCGHRDTQATTCPGQHLYSALPDLRQKTANSLAGPASPVIGISSGADGGPKAGTVNYAWSAPGASAYSYYLETWQLDSDGSLVYVSGFTGEKTPQWSAWSSETAKSFPVVASGHYTFHVRARNGAGNVGVYQDNRTIWGVGKGDLDGDGDIDINDVLLSLQHTLGLPSSPYAGTVGDINCDNLVEIPDTLNLLQHLVGLPVSYPPDCPPIFK